MQKLIDSWRICKLTFLCKIIVIKTLILPKLIYSASILPLPEKLIKDVNKILYSFIWGKTEKIKRRVLINEYEKGGLKMIDIQCHLMVLKAWLLRINKNKEEVWTLLPQAYIKRVTGSLVLQINFSNAKHFPRLQCVPLFYQEIIYAVCRTNIPNKITGKGDLYNQMLWGNRFLLTNGKCLYDQSFIDAGYIYVHNILNADGTLRTDIYYNLNFKKQTNIILELCTW